MPNSTINLYEFQNHTFNIISLNNVIITSQYDILVATLYSTLFTTLSYYKTEKHLYLVQNYETDFYSYNHYFRAIAEKTYSTKFNIQFQNGVKIGFGKDIIKKQNMLQMELILIYINHIKEI